MKETGCEQRAADEPRDSTTAEPLPLPSMQPLSIRPLSPAGNRDWLAALLLRRPERFMFRFAAALARFKALPRGYRRRLRRKMAVTAAGAALILAMAGSPLLVPPAHAATIVVNETTCTLIDAIIAANTDTANDGCAAGDPGLDIIDLQADVLLTASYATYYNSPTGLPLVTSEIVIEGNGNTLSRDTADTDKFRLLAVSSTGDLTINDATLSGGYAYLNDGFAIDNSGGAVSNRGSLALTGVIVSNNSAYDNGGGIHNDDGTVTISDSSFTGNTADNDGGAISQNLGTTTINDSTFTGNIADTDGGAIVNYYGSMTVTNSTFSGNSAPNGGAIYNYDEMTITDCVFTGNTSYSGHGGGAVYNAGVMTIITSTLTGNKTDGDGGGVYNDIEGDLTILHSTIDGNTAGGPGGGINNLDTLAITNSTISGNSAEYGGGVYNDNEATITITNVTITGNTATDSGGGLYNDFEGTATLARSIISGNDAPTGPEIYQFYNASLPPGTVNADNFNLFGFDGDAGTVNFTPTGTDIVPGAGVLVADILNTTLADNGGPTQTHLLVDGSPALDVAPSADCVAPPTDGVDQRGAPRNQDAGGGVTANECDIGAVEGTVSTSTVAADIYMSTTVPGTTADGLAFGGEDIIEWDGTEWTTLFDGSAAGLTPTGTARHNINAFFVEPPGTDFILMSFAQNARTVPGVGKVDGMDAIVWNGSSFQLVFDGQDVGLTNLTSEKIDGLHVLPGTDAPPELIAAAGGSCQVYMLVSTAGAGKVPNYSGGTLNFGGEDVLGFCFTSNGSNTSGKWIKVLDGSNQGMPRNSTDSISLSEDGNTLYLTTKGTFVVDDAVGGHSMIYEYDMTTTEFSGPTFIAADNGLPKKVDGLQVE